MSFLATLEQIAYAPLNTTHFLEYLVMNNLNNNHAMQLHLARELSDDKLNICYTLFACETHVVSVP